MFGTNTIDPVRPLSPAEQSLVNDINGDSTWSNEYARQQLNTHLQLAAQIELATIPIYLYTYYSINRTPTDFPSTPLSRFADKAGAEIMSVAVEEMLHMSLASNVYYSLFATAPALYRNSPEPYPTNLPGHTMNGPDGQPLSIPLAKFSYEHLYDFLEIEYPAKADAPPQPDNWDTIGQVYSYVRCIISSKWISDADFQKGIEASQIQDTNYSPNNIDTIYPDDSFNKTCPIPTPVAGSAATVAKYTNDEDGHSGSAQLLTIATCDLALQAIQTIDAQGEGYYVGDDDTPFDDIDPGTGLGYHEFSHYYKFLLLQSSFTDYNPSTETLATFPAPPPAASTQFDSSSINSVVFNWPDNPTSASYSDGYKDVVDVVSGLYQYMLIMTEGIFQVPPKDQKLYFNQALHRSMIWILDKVIQSMRTVVDSKTGLVLAPTFENVNLGDKSVAFATLKTMCSDLDSKYGTESWYTIGLKYYVDQVPTLYDVSGFWGTSSPSFSECTVPTGPAIDLGARPVLVNAVTKETACDVSGYTGVPKFPQHPPATVAHGEVRHACMGLNSCKNQGRTRDNNCAGQGYCSTALAYNYKDYNQPLAQDHTCHVLNACAGQGGCGLYGTSEEENVPGANDCATLGSCATPINAERFSTDGTNKGKSVWVRARQVFETQTYPKMQKSDPSLPVKPGPVPYPQLFQYGPTIEWVHDYSGQGMTACGSSGMSGAGSCA